MADRKEIKINPGAVWVGEYKDKKTGEMAKRLSIKVNLEFFPSIIKDIQAGAKTLMLTALPNSFKTEDKHPSFNLKVSDKSEVQGLGAENHGAAPKVASEFPTL